MKRDHDPEKLVESLQSPDCYPHAADEVTLIETHISWVLLAGNFVYKLKKPVDFGFLDFSSLEKRHHFCQEELRLNGRFSDDLYLEVVSITGTDAAPRINGDGEPIEYAVLMRRFDQSSLLDKLAETDGLTIKDMQSLGRRLADFHAAGAARLQPDELDAEDSRQAYGTPEQVLDDALDNFSQIRKQLDGDRHLASRLDALEQWTRGRFGKLRTLLEKRRKAGFVRECHGDLHLGNIARIHGEITFFDCIEFNPALRWIDIQSELAFLLMDIEEKGLGKLANRLLNTWLEFSGDYEGLALLPFFKVYRAMVRAKVKMLSLADEDLSEAERSALEHDFDTYLTLAESYCHQPSPFLAMMHGVSGTGKSTVAAELAATRGAIRIRSDVERKRLFGIGPETRSTKAQEKQLYTREASRRTFAELQRLAALLLETGFSVIVDATFIAEHERRPFVSLAERARVGFMIVDCLASEATLVKRLTERQERGGDASDAGVAVMQRQLETADPFTGEEQPFVVPLDTEQTLDEALLSGIKPKVS